MDVSDLLKVSSNPHIRSKDTTSRIMLYVIISLLPAAGFGVYNFGLHALAVIIVTIASTVLTEYIYEKCMKKKITVGDLSAVVTMLFGGLGQNFMNPALGARCFLMISFTSLMTNFNCDTYTGATPLAALKAGERVDVMDMIIGRTAGTIGETSMVALIIGACILILLGVIDLKVPGSYIVTFVIFIAIFGGHGFDSQYISANLAGGGLMLGAFFMATDYVTRPITKKGQYLYGIFLGIMTGIFRVFGPSAEGVSYAIILGNLLVPLIEKVTMPKAFGKGGERA